MKITIVGIGYVGLSNAILLSQNNEVTALDISEDKVNKVNSKLSPIEDKEIEEYLRDKPLNLKATTESSGAYKDADYIIVSAPTDYDSAKNYFCVDIVNNVIETALAHNPTAVIVIKSTVPVGYTEILYGMYGDRFIFSPEFLREGKALYDNLYPSRIIVGVPKGSKLHSAAERYIALLTAGAIKTDVETLIMGATEAEAVKLFSNTYLAMRVAYFNEIDTYSDIRGLNPKDIIKGMCLDSRIGDYYNNPSFGYGGYCLPKDTKQLLANYSGVPNEIVGAVVQANRTRKDYIAARIIEKISHFDEKNRVVGIYRLTMKAGSDNFRHSSVQGIIRRLNENDITVIIYEPSFTDARFFGNDTVGSLAEFKKRSSLIVANRYHAELSDVMDKVYTKDLFMKD